MRFPPRSDNQNQQSEPGQDTRPTQPSYMPLSAAQEHYVPRPAANIHKAQALNRLISSPRMSPVLPLPTEQVAGFSSDTFSNSVSTVPSALLFLALVLVLPSHVSATLSILSTVHSTAHPGSLPATKDVIESLMSFSFVFVFSTSSSWVAHGRLTDLKVTVPDSSQEPCFFNESTSCSCDCLYSVCAICTSRPHAGPRA